VRIEYSAIADRRFAGKLVQYLMVPGKPAQTIYP